MKKNNTAAGIRTDSGNLQRLAQDLHDIHAILSDLCSRLGGGGIVQARDIEPTLARSVTEIGRACATLDAAAERPGQEPHYAGVTTPDQAPLLM